MALCTLELSNVLSLAAAMMSTNHRPAGTRVHRVARGMKEDTMSIRAVTQKRSSMRERKKRAEEHTTKVLVGIVRWCLRETNTLQVTAGATATDELRDSA